MELYRVLRRTAVIIFLTSLVGAGVMGCGSSSSSATGTISGSSGGGIGEAEPLGGEDENVYARGRVVTPDTVAVSNAFIRTDPPVATTQADSMGRFQFNEPFSDSRYTFIAISPGEGREGRTTVRSPSEDMSRKTIYVIIGKEGRLNAIDIDSVRASPSGPGLRRSGN